MKAFDELTQQGQIRRYHRLAKLALKSYPIEVKQIRCISSRHNILFRVDTADASYALKIGYPNIRTSLMVQSEMQWLEDMKKAELDLNMSIPIRTSDGKLLVSHQVDEVPEERHIVLMTWLKGRLISQKPTAKKLKQLGSAMATLHNFSEQYTPSQPFMPFDAFRCNEWGGLAYLDESHPFLSSEQKALFKKAIDTAENALSAVRESEGLKLIHADLHLKNAMWHQRKVSVFDFDDCRWGHYLQDLGVVLAWFEEKPAEMQALRDAFLKGYQSKRNLLYSEQDLTFAVMHRRMVGLTFIMNYRPLARRLASEEAEKWLRANL